MKKIDEIRICLTKKINRNELMGKKHKKCCRILNYTDHLLIVVGIPKAITSSAIGLEICIRTAGIKKYKLIKKKKKKEHDKIGFLWNSKLSRI